MTMIASPERFGVEFKIPTERDESVPVPETSPSLSEAAARGPSPQSSVVERKETDQRRHDATDETLYLVGRPTLKQFLRFVKNHAVDPPDKASLIEEWHAANKTIGLLEQEEAGLVDNPPIIQMDISKYEPLLVEFLKSSRIRNGFNTVPTEVAFVELDRMVVYQHHIDLTYVRQLENMLGPSPNEEKVFRMCLLHDRPQPPVKWSRIHRNSFIFMSLSNDLRLLESMQLQPRDIKGHPFQGDFAGIVGIAVGFGSNYMNAVCAEKRLILNNGSHRAYALRKLGVTHVPCIIQHVSSRHELDVVAASSVEEEPDYYLKNPRPPMLKDYFDARLHKVVQVHREMKQITVRFDVDETYVPVL